MHILRCLLVLILVCVICGGLITPTSGDIKDLRVCTLRLPTNKGTQLNQCRWRDGVTVLKVRFLDGDPRVQDKVKFYAAEWTQYSGITFTFVDVGEANIRISFSHTGSWSLLGACQSEAAQNQATMNFGWLTPDTDDPEYRRVVLHEFGHALGLVHEHQNPKAPFVWNRDAVYRYYSYTQHWNKKEVDTNIIQRYSRGEANSSDWDPDSIMEYPIPQELIKSGKAIGWNTDLSRMDKKFMCEIYGKQRNASSCQFQNSSGRTKG